MKKLLLLISICAFHSAIGQSLNTIESVEYDHANSRFLVSNSNSIIAIDHQTQELSFFGDGAASFGMEVMNNTLFVIDNGIKAYDLTTEEEVMDYNIPGSGFLNGMASDGNGRLWVTDFSNRRVYEINVEDMSNPSHDMVVANTVNTPNGIVFDEDNNRLIFVGWGSNAPVKAVSLPDYDVTTLTGTSLGNCDGIDNDNENNFYVSSWSPLRISRFTEGFDESPETIEAPGISSPADICYAKEIDTLAIPNSGNSTVTFIGFESTLSIQDQVENALNFSLVGNPVSAQSYFNFTAKQNAQVQLLILDETGKTVATLIDGNRAPGEYKVLLNGIELASGLYIASLRIGDTTSTQKVVVN